MRTYLVIVVFWCNQENLVAVLLRDTERSVEDQVRQWEYGSGYKVDSCFGIEMEAEYQEAK